MYIKKAELTNFGKFHQKTLSFSRGLNVVYGENESGKSTLHSFLLAMLFGLEKQRGRGRRNDMYQRCEPWNAAAYYAGSLEFAVTGETEKDFRIERNFYHKEKSARLYNLKDGEELSVAHGDLDILLGGVRRGLYENTYCVSQAAVVTEADFAELLERELAGSMYGGESGIDVAKALQTLEERRRKEEQKLKREQQSRRERQERLEWEQEVLLSDIRKLEEKREEAARRIEEERVAGSGGHMKEESPEEYGRCIEEERIAEDKRHMENESTPEHGRSRENILWRVPLIGWILRFFRYIFRHVFRGKKKNSGTDAGANPGAGHGKSAADTNTGVEHGKTAAHTMAVAYSLLTEQLAEKKTRLLNMGEEIDEVSGTTKNERAIQTELKSIHLAQEVLERVARESYRSNRDGIQAAISAVFSGITDGRYENLEVTEAGQVTVCKDDRSLEPWQLSRGALEQLYLALRLGTGRCLMKEEPMPLLLDETFCAYDDRRLARTLKWLADQQEQVILFTCQKREMELLEQMGAVFHKIILHA